MKKDLIIHFILFLAISPLFPMSKAYQFKKDLGLANKKPSLTEAQKFSIRQFEYAEKEKLEKESEAKALSEISLGKNRIGQEIIWGVCNDPQDQKALRLTCKFYNRMFLDPRVKAMRDICNDTTCWIPIVDFRDIGLYTLRPELLRYIFTEQENKLPSHEQFSLLQNKIRDHNEKLKDALSFAVRIDNDILCSYLASRMIRMNNDLDNFNRYRFYRNIVIDTLASNGSDSNTFHFLIKEDPFKCKNYLYRSDGDRQVIVGPIMEDIRHKNDLTNDKRNEALIVCQENGCKTYEMIWQEKKEEQRVENEKFAAVFTNDNVSKKSQSECCLF